MAVPRKEFTATAIGHTLRTVVCEQCGSEYIYGLKCEGIGSGTSVLFLDNLGAEGRAEKAAQDALAEKLKNAVDGVPCPKCGWYQASMVKHLRDSWGGALGFTGIAITALALFGLFMSAILGYVTWVGEQRGKGPTLPQIGWISLGCGAAAVAGLGLCYLRSVLASGVEPNNDPVGQRLELGRRRAALAEQCTPERTEELLVAAGARDPIVG
jgi:hypothetical protein